MAWWGWLLLGIGIGMAFTIGALLLVMVWARPDPSSYDHGMVKRKP